MSDINEQDEDSVSARAVYESLLSEGLVKHSITLEPLKVLVINSFILPDEEADSLRKAMSTLSLHRNMPFAFWSNRSGGLNTGSFIRRLEDFDFIFSYLETVTLGVPKESSSLKIAITRLFHILHECDPNSEFEYYQF